MSRHSESTLAAIKAAVDITALVGDYLQLHRAGPKYKALCPFHDDHNPSLEVNPERQSYTCWSCGARGDIFDFVKDYERVDFPEALRMLAERAGIALDRRDSAPPTGPTKVELLAAADWAARAYASALDGVDEASAYLAGRGLSPGSAAMFGLGFAPAERGWIAARARKAGVPAQHLEAIGLLAASEQPPHRLRDRFRGRLVFPIRDGRGRVIGFGGRILPSAQKAMAEAGRPAAKYLNSPETSLFQKRRLLYAADLARPAARKAGFVAVVEGYTDVIAAHQVGLANVVATLGTALGDDHVPELRRLADRVVLVFDGDEAGQKAADRTLDLFLGHELDARVLALPAGLDPCDFLLEHGAEAFSALIGKAVDPLEFAVRRAAGRFDLRSAEGAQQAAELVLGIIARAPIRHETRMNLKVVKSLDVLSRRLGVPVVDLKRRLSELRDSVKKPRAAAHDSSPPSSLPIRPGDLDPVDRELVQVALNDPSSIPRLIARVAAGSVKDPALRAILQTCYDLHAEAGEAGADRVLIRLDADPALKSLAIALTQPIDGQPLASATLRATWADRLARLLARLDDRDWNERKRDLDAALKDVDPTTHPDEHRALWLERQRLNYQRPGSKAKNAS